MQVSELAYDQVTENFKYRKLSENQVEVILCEVNLFENIESETRQKNTQVLNKKDFTLGLHLKRGEILRTSGFELSHSLKYKWL